MRASGRRAGPASLEATPVDPAIEALSEAARRLAEDGDAAPQTSGPTTAPGQGREGRSEGRAVDGRDPRAGETARVAASLSLLRWQRLQSEGARRERVRRRRTAGVALALAVLAVGAAGGRRWATRTRAVDYLVEGRAAVGEGGYIHDVVEGGAHLRFSEGTRVDLDPGTRAWVVARGPDGARLRLEDGGAHFDVIHRSRSSWAIDAGPFAILVTGTNFDVRWSGADERLEVMLNRGEVRVSGPLDGGGVVLRPGQRLTARVHERELRIEGPLVHAVGPAAPGAGGVPVGGPLLQRVPVPEGAPSAAPPAAAGVDRVAPSTSRSRAPASRTAAPSRASRLAMSKPAATPAPLAPPRSDPAGWARRVAAGDFAGVLQEAQRHGIDACVTAWELDALSALADAALYLSKNELARRVLLAERRRFPGSSPARAAAFLLARLADETGLGARAAVEWYDRYLGESPDGTYAADALGRKMLAVDKLSEHAEARRIAAEYQRRFPNGGYLPQATALLRRP